MCHEQDAKLRDEVVWTSRRRRLVHQAEAAFARTAVARYEGRAFRHSAVVLVNYDSVRALLEDAYGADLPIRRIAYAAMTAFEPESPVDVVPAGLPAGEAPLVVAVSRHDGRKGLDVLVRALARLSDEGVPFRACLVGPGILLEAHRALVRELGLAGHVALPGRVEHVMPYLRAADLFCLPSTEEGSGSLSVLEALQAGVAIVSTDVDGMPEDLDDGENALLVPPRDPVALARAIARLLTDPGERAQLGRQARTTYERRFSPAAAMADLGAVYAELGLPARRTASATRATSDSVIDGPDGR